MARKAILHIGPMKTGSTSIQHWLYTQGAALEEAGFKVPKGLGRNMSRLSSIAQATAFGEPPQPSDAERLERLRAEVATLPGRVHTLVFSGEMLAQQLHVPREVRAVKRILNEFCDDYTVIVYLRRQDSLSISRYSTALRRGERRARPLSRAIDYEQMLFAWTKVFGREAMRVRIFDRSALVNNDVVEDFASVAGLPFVPARDGPIDQNPSLRPEAQRFLALFAERLRAAGFDQSLSDLPGFDEINRLLTQHYRGVGILPSRAEALAFYEDVRAANERVRQEWFPDQATLFDESFDEYPEEAPQPVSSEALLSVTMDLLTKTVLGRADAGQSRRRRAADRRGPEEPDDEGDSE